MLFLNFCLDSIVKSLVKSISCEEDFLIKFRNLNDVIAPKYIQWCKHFKLKLLTPKGVSSYVYIDSYDKVNKTFFPENKLLFLSLTQEEISIEKRENAKDVWLQFQCEKKDYLYFYLMCNVLLLADVIKHFRLNSLSEYDLDPVYFVSSPHMEWNAMLKQTNLLLELITDPEMYRMIQPNIRGGICHCSVRYARANNKYMGTLYNSNEPSSYIVCFDINNLYVFAMFHKLPHNSFEWVSSEDLSK